MERTVDELAQAAGTKVSTIRLYQQRGLLPAPRLTGRTGWYGEHHLVRLQVIDRLQGRGFSLAAIKELIDEAEQGHDLDAVLGIGDAHEAWARMGREELVELLPALADAVLFARAIELGALRAAGEDLDVNTGYLEVGRALGAMGVPDSVQLEEFARVQELADDTARRFLDLFETYVWPRYEARADDPAAIAELLEAVSRLRSMASKVVDGVLRESIDAAAQAALPRLAERIGLVDTAGERP